MECKALFRLGVNICSHLISGAMLKSDFPLVDFVIYIKDLTDVCLLCVYRKYGIVEDVCITANNCNCQ